MSSSYEAINFTKVLFLSTSQLVLFQLAAFNPRWEFLLLNYTYSLGDYIVSWAIVRHNLKLCFSLNEIFKLIYFNWRLIT